MNFKDAVICVELIMDSGAVPLIIGESGIGKTALVKSICEERGYSCIKIEGNMLKEGEIGGLPTIENFETEVEGKTVILKRTVYAIHTKLQEMSELAGQHPDNTIILFIDEINRCEHSVQQELMNIILNREINGYNLPKEVKVMAAMNPSNKYEDYNYTDYQVVDMDPAQEDRFVWVTLEADVKSWLSWGMENIHKDVLGFISSFPDYLHTPQSKEMVKATPRSWERVSDIYKTYIHNKEKIPARIFYNAVKGNVGTGIAQEFINYIQSNKQPLISPEEIFEGESAINEIISRMKEEGHSRLYMTSRNVFQYLKNKEDNKKDVELFSKLLQYYPADLKIAVMKELKELYGEDLYPKFLMDDNFIEGFFKTYSDMKG